ncbi:MAG: Smr/MutS family protein [Helicobacteraceae bacterium]|jgi:DNA mismatch repair protein MutS2|nr:Smr/MutS family protein [Helicobacteraceae bacterium]
MELLIKRLDLEERFSALASFFAREKPFTIEGDAAQNAALLDELESLDIPALPQVQNLDSAIARLAKGGVARIGELFDFARIVRFFETLKLRDYEGKIGEKAAEWASAIEAVKPLKNLTAIFDYDGEIIANEEIARLKSAIDDKKKQAKYLLSRVASDSKLAPYLVDRQVHIVGGEETLLLRGGFNRLLSGRVVDRTQAGFFYVLPRALGDIKGAIEDLENEKISAIAKLEREHSAALFAWVKSLRFINAAFDRFDSLAARVNFAKANDLTIVAPNNSSNVILSAFCHPALKNPTPISIDFSKPIALITGVNAGGKTMLLKSILSAVLMAKYLIPMKIDGHKSAIGRFKGIEAVIADPQDARNDISTFAGRMKQFAPLFSKENLIIGVDEIELGTDSDEAASLFKAILERLSDRASRIVVTTHNKRLAALTAKNDRVELFAALYDEKNQKPTFSFLQGSIGRSYAFETALRYGISHTVVSEAQRIYGEDRERLNDLIERSSALERQMRQNIAELNADRNEIARQKEALNAEREALNEEYKKRRSALEKDYKAAIDAAKAAAKAPNEADRHRALNAANALKNAIEPPSLDRSDQTPQTFREGDSVEYLGAIGEIASIKGDRALIESGSARLYAPINELKKAVILPQKAPKVFVQKPQTASFKIDLHGLRVEEALELLDKFLSDALIAGFDEALIVHGIGSGALARAVREALKSYPHISSFSDAPANMGGIGATLAKF